MDTRALPFLDNGTIQQILLVFDYKNIIVNYFLQMYLDSVYTVFYFKTPTFLAP